MTEPLVSVVMPSFNQVHFLERAIESVLSQDYGLLELVVSDGGSTDGSVNLLELFCEHDARLRWSSAQDSGPANAINKALKRTRGTIIGWLNSDDLYAPGAVARAVEAFQSHPDWIMCYGQGEHIDEADETLSRYPTLPPHIAKDALGETCCICQPTVFFKRSALTLVGDLDERFKTSFDYEYWLRIFSKMPERIGFIDKVQAMSRLHEKTITATQRLTVALEGIELGHKYFGQGRINWLYGYMSEARPQFEGAGGLDKFQTHAEEVLKKARPFIPASDLARLRENLNLPKP